MNFLLAFSLTFSVKQGEKATIYPYFLLAGKNYH